ncbi:trehalose operon repressor [Lacticaseibacillus rhamnosus]|uniref:trehalose operon repressor n=1 Tax=Lacticaseibacillus rhamnosus TaxID=47715 RepID=UPI0007DFBB0C|nr:trehalose operon repressor [Lacticaseibacillus rhamnosus]OFN11925.1 trehalose operon repressor [Lactobacillus sp. HMSC072E07]MCT3191427.1 trehalose operon repressor [Lacticaseibacillus rhamnosus]MCT3371535.1 trehalose operon repressor [Lacticaseibacillus rhamnosus]MDK7184128.1 trehalose operon repressor [Lacticaseibacillus rhamnosus]MDK7240375.1 trehalose operon repressor [Lacticaseibacillus rhamnosus]
MRKYDAIYQDLKEKIEAEIYATGSLLPSESALQDMYQASRDTVRKALRLLKDDGFIQSQKGKGSTVINRQEYVFPVSGVVSYAELAAQFHLQTRTVVLTNHFATLPAKSFKDVDPTVEVKQMRLLKRVRYLENEPDIIDIDYLDPKVVPPIPESVAKDSLYAYLEGPVGLNIAYATKEITVETATEEDQRYLKIPPSAVVVVVRSCSSLTDTTKFQYTESRHRADRFKFHDFARRIRP